jgi:mannose-6-phosphate isomerase-like protein (cupin superfamily)
MTENLNTSAIPPDDPSRSLTVADPDNPRLRHISIGGGTYTVLVSGAQTAGHYCLIDMHVPDGSGPPPHRHDFEEMFTLLEGSLEFTFRGQTLTVGAGLTVNIPSNAPHSFKNISGQPVRMLCMCTPAGQEEYFLEVGDLVDGRVAPPPKLTAADITARRAKAAELATTYRTEFLPVSPPAS